MSGLLGWTLGSTSVPSAHRPARQLAVPADHMVMVWLRRLKAITIVLPVTIIVLLVLVELIVVERMHPSSAHLILAGAALLAVVTFGVAMYLLIGHAHRVITRQNRALAAVTAVSTAVSDDLDVDQIVDRALECVLEWSGAAQVWVTATVPADRLPGEDVATWQRAVTPGPGRTARAAPAPAVAVPLVAGGCAVGTMQLWLPADAGSHGVLEPDTLRVIGQQLGSAIRRAQLFADLQRRKREGHALYDILLLISRQSTAVSTLSSVVGYARDLLQTDEAALCLRRTPPGMAPLRPAPPGGFPSAGGLMCVTADGVQACATRQGPCPLRQPARYPATCSVPVRGFGEPASELWLGRRSDRAFGRRDASFLATLSELAGLALAQARTLEDERHGATLAERVRIAREMHDSLAQVLGATHLRLRAVAGRPEIINATELAAELTELGDICQEAFHDVREAILGLHEAGRSDRALLESLRAYARKYAQQSGISTTVDSAVDDELNLEPRSEVQVIRVIQEALTNVRKHSGARQATVRLSGTPEVATFVVEDDGRGFDPDVVSAERDGFGLHSMRERMRLVDGSLTIESAPGGGGTRVIVSVPTAGRAPCPPREAVRA